MDDNDNDNNDNNDDNDYNNDDNNDKEYKYLIGIIGLGILGNAIKETFEFFPNIKIKCYDKYKVRDINIKNTIHTTNNTTYNTIYCNTIQELLLCDIIFLCLPTEYDDIKKEYDKTEIDLVCSELAFYRYQGIIILKSTVEPKTTENISIKYKSIYPYFNIVHSPEFLSARTATEDFTNQNHIVIGFDNSYNLYNLYNLNNLDNNINYALKFTTIEYLKTFYESFFPNAKISLCSSNESESMKIFCNSFYASKIQIFTEFKLLCDKMDINYNNVKKLMLSNGWINPMHTQVPGQDGQLSFGGKCFPKDIKALNELLKKMEVPNKVIDAVVEENNDMREF